VVASIAAALSLGVFAGSATSSAASDPILLAAGDIAECDKLGDEATAAILDANPEGTVATLGDLAYPDGTAAQFESCYGPTWGRHKARTRPAVGNHEYHTPGAAGYFDYMGAAAGEPGKGYYSYDLGSWHVIVLNSNCNQVPCHAGSAQEQWLLADLAANPVDCTLAYFHHPRFSSAQHGNDAGVSAFWTALYAAGADVVLSGHDHVYERFDPQTPAAVADPAHGIRQFTVGTGGRDPYGFVTTRPNSVVRHTGTRGVLKLVLRMGTYDWEFLSEAGKTFTDSGSGSCHGAADGGPPANPIPASTHSTAWSNDRTVDVSWSGASDSGSGVDGFSYHWTQDPTSIPDTAKDAEETVQAATSPELADGQWWFQLRTRDNAGNWSDTTTLGPFAIDGTAPSNPTLSSPGHVPGEWTNDATVEVAWAGAADAASGLDGYAYTWSQVATTDPGTTKTAEEGATGLVSEPLADGDWWFHLRAVDNAGNGAEAVHVGPFRIDTLAPLNPTLASPSHQVGIWSSATRVVVEWTAGPGVDAYSFEWSSAADTIPDTTADADGSQTTASATRPDGSSWFHLRARDAATGQWSHAAHVGPFLIDSTAPDTTIIGGPPRFALFASEPATFRCSLDDAPPADCPSFLDFDALPPGDHVLRVAAVDRVGNTDPTPAERRWRVEGDAPPPPPPPPVDPPKTGRTARCIVPRLTGRTLSRSRTLITRAGCRLGRVTRAYSARVATGRVLKQRPRAGVRLPHGTRIAVTVSRGRR
jgi:Calcineurin-like phosphoesterase/PASTA domain